MRIELAFAAMTAACARPSPAPSVVGPRPAPSASAVATAPPVPEAPKPSQPRLRAIAKLPGAQSLFELDGGVVLAGHNFIAKLGDDGLTVSDELSAGLELHRALTTGLQSLSGSRAGRAVAVVERMKGDSLFGEVYTWRKDTWAILPTQPKQRFIGASEWSGGRILLLEAATPAKFLAHPGAKAVLPELAPAPKATAAPSDADKSLCDHAKTALLPAEMLALQSGHVFAAGTLCDTRVAGVEWWAPGAKKSTLRQLPGVESRGPTVKLAGRRAEDVWASVSETLAHFDGKDWTPVDAPFSAEILSLSLTEQGTLLVGSNGSGVWMRSAAGDWSELAFEPSERSAPDSSKPWSIVARSADDVWVMMGDTVFHSRSPRGAVQRIEPERYYRPPNDTFRPREPATPRCKTIFVLVYATTHFAPFEYDYPVLRSVLGKLGRREGLRLARLASSTKERGFVGVLVPGLAEAGRVVELLRQDLPLTQPKAYCYDAPAQSFVDIDSGRITTPD